MLRFDWRNYDVGQVLVNPIVGMEKSLVCMIFVYQGFDLSDFVGGVEVLLVFWNYEGSFIKIHVGAD